MRTGPPPKKLTKRLVESTYEIDPTAAVAALRAAFDIPEDASITFRWSYEDSYDGQMMAESDRPDRIVVVVTERGNSDG